MSWSASESVSVDEPLLCTGWVRRQLDLQRRVRQQITRQNDGVGLMLGDGLDDVLEAPMGIAQNKTFTMSSRAWHAGSAGARFGTSVAFGYSAVLFLCGSVMVLRPSSPCLAKA
jgi:hypothetical protein